MIIYIEDKAKNVDIISVNKSAENPKKSGDAARIIAENNPADLLNIFFDIF
mgnify:CR=1 FL=1